MDSLLQHTQHMVLEHPLECAVLCIVSVMATLAVQRWLP
jgi:hypothetical protein